MVAIYSFMCKIVKGSQNVTYYCSIFMECEMGEGAC